MVRLSHHSHPPRPVSPKTTLMHLRPRFTPAGIPISSSSRLILTRDVKNTTCDTASTSQAFCNPGTISISSPELPTTGSREQENYSSTLPLERHTEHAYLPRHEYE